MQLLYMPIVMLIDSAVSLIVPSLHGDILALLCLLMILYQLRLHFRNICSLLPMDPVDISQMREVPPTNLHMSQSVASF